MNEPDTCRTLVLSNLKEAGWDDTNHFVSKQSAFKVVGIYTWGNLLAVIKAKEENRLPSSTFMRAGWVLANASLEVSNV